MPSTTSTLSCQFFSRSIFAVGLFAACIAVGGLSGCSKTKKSGDGSETGADVGVQDLELANQQRYGEGNIPKPAGEGAFPDIHFEYDSSQVPPQHQEDVRKLGEALMNDPQMHAEVEGHCDKRGTNEYNLALGEERARAVARLLASYGAKPSQISTVSYGEEIPLDPSDSEDAFAKNRRAHFALFSKDS